MNNMIQKYVLLTVIKVPRSSLHLKIPKSGVEVSHGIDYLFLSNCLELKKRKKARPKPFLYSKIVVIRSTLLLLKGKKILSSIELFSQS